MYNEIAYSKIYKALKWRYIHKKLDKVFYFLSLVVYTIIITSVVLAIIYNIAYPRLSVTSVVQKDIIAINQHYWSIKAHLTQ